jgi:hypothetical protein
MQIKLSLIWRVSGDVGVCDESWDRPFYWPRHGLKAEGAERGLVSLRNLQTRYRAPEGKVRGLNGKGARLVETRLLFFVCFPHVLNFEQISFPL